MVGLILPASGLTQLLALAVHVLIAGIVTAHVLLRKSDIRAALGWIGVAWLSPLLGGLLYYLFGINRVTRRAMLFETHESGWKGAVAPAEPMAVLDNIVALAEIGHRVTGIPLTAGNRVALLHGGDEAYPEMLTAIRNARRSIALASYIFRYDAIGRAFTEALMHARRRGVAVRVLLDGMGAGYICPVALRHFEAEEIPSAQFLHTWLPWRMPFLNMRNHKKLLIIDGTIGFTGGLNIGAKNSARRTSQGSIDDIHARIEGPVVGQLMETFARDWSFTTGEALDQDIWWPSLESAGPVFARGIRSGPDADIYKLEAILATALAQARTRVRIATPYFLPEQRLQFAISQAQLRGVSVDIVIPGRSDYFFLNWAVRAHLRNFGGLPGNVYFSHLPFDHSKLMTVDGEWSLIGSSNWDTRSLRLNFECNLECYDSALTAQIDALIDQKISRSQKCGSDDLFRAPKWVQLRDAAVRLLLPYL